MNRESRSQLTRFYFGTFWLYSADLFVLLAARWGIVAGGGSAITLALVFILHALPQLAVGIVGPERVGGHRRLPIVAVLGGIGLAAVSVAAFAGGGRAFVLLLLTASFLAGWANAVAVPLGQASLMQCLPAAQRVRGSRGYEIASRIPTLAGPIVGGALIGLLGVRELLVGAMVFFLLAASAYRRWTLPAFAPSPRLGSLRQSLTAIRGDRWLLTALTVRGLQNLFWPAFSLGLPLLVVGRLHGGALAYGFLLTCYGVATLLSAGLSARLRLSHLRWLYYLSWVTTGLGFLVLSAATSMAAAGAGALLAGIGSPFVHMALDTHIGTNVAVEVQSALFGFQRLVMSVLGLVGSYAVGLWLTVDTPHGALATSGEGLAVIGVAGALAMLLLGRRARSSDAHSLPGQGA